MDTIVVDLLSFLQALKSGGLIGYLVVFALVLIVLAALVIGAFVYKRVVTKRLMAASKAAQAVETMAVNLRKRALKVKELDDDLRKRELEVKEHDDLKGFSKVTNAELTSERQRPQQQQVLKKQQQALKQSVSRAITFGLKDIQISLLQTDFKRMMSVASSSSKVSGVRHPRVGLATGCGVMPAYERSS